MEFNSIKQLIDYRNKIYTRAIARTRTFKDNYKNYYWTRLKEIDEVLNNVNNNNNTSNFNSLGKIILKKTLIRENI